MNKFNQTEILEALNRLNQSEQDVLNPELISKAEGQVWSSISKFLVAQKLPKPMPNNTQLTPTNQLNSKWQQWWKKKYHLVFAFLGSFTILVIIFIFSYNVAFRLIKPQTQLNSIDEPVSLEELRTKAEAKFIKLSNGIPFQEVQQGIKTPTNNPNSIPGQPAQPIIDEKLQQDIQTKTDPNNLTVFFSESEEKYFLPLNLPFADFDISKSLTTKIWISGNFSKAVDYYDNKIINLSVNTPEYQISYLGGKYAIKGVYTKPYYLSSITIPSPKDVEIELLKNLLNPIDSNRIIDYGLQTVNNKKLRVIEVKHDILPPLNNQYNTSPNENTPTTFNQTQATQTVTNYIFTTSTKYYFDQDDLTLHLTEDYTNNQLLKQTKLIKSQILENQQADKIFNYQELGNLPIKEYKIYAYDPDDYLVTNFVKKYDLYFVPELGLENIYYCYLSDHVNSVDSHHHYYYYYDPDFNPNVKQQGLNYTEDLPSLPKNYLGSCYQTPLEISIYEEDKPKYEDMFPYGKQARFKVKKERDVQILLNKDQPINGKYLELALRFEDGTIAQNEDQDVKTILVIEFKVGKYWYILSYDLENSTMSSSASNFDLKNYLSQDQIWLSKLTLEQAREIDQKNQQKYLQNDTTTPQSTTNLD